MNTLTAKQIHDLLRLVADPTADIDIDTISHLLSLAINGDPGQREKSSRSIATFIESKLARH